MHMYKAKTTFKQSKSVPMINVIHKYLGSSTRQQ